MRLPQNLIAPAAFVLAAGLSVLAAFWASAAIEQRTASAVKSLMTQEGLSWVQVETTGLQVRLAGTAPTEALRFRAMNLTATLVDSGRIRDLMDVIPARAIEAPRFSVELLRNDDGISLIGLVPSVEGEVALADEVASIAAGAQIADMLTKAEFPPPQGWDTAVDYGLKALRMLPRSKISIEAGRVTITAISGSEDEKRRYESQLASARPDGIIVALDISAPRPVLTPFTLRFLKDERGARFDACSADTEAARSRITTAAVAAGMTGKAECVIGLGVPTPRWAEAAALGIAAVNDLGSGSITFSDADVTLLATVETPQATFDRVVGELQTALPDVFSLKATLPEKPKDAAAEGPAEFTANLSPDGQIQLRGRLTDVTFRDAVASYAKAQFGAGAVYTATRLDPELPDGWPVRVLAGLEAMSELTEGSLIVRPDMVEVTGVTASPAAQATITRTLSDKLGQGQAFTVNVRYDEALDPTADLPTPQECVATLNAALAKKKITFAPGSAEIESDARDTMEALADELRRCPDIAMEIAGHTDSQGGEQSNLALSQARAEAVLLGLQGRRVLVGALTAKGYGETRPIADNATEAGREANRRIEFTLLTTADATAAAPAAEGATAAPDGSIDPGAAASSSAGNDDPGTGDGDPTATEDPGTGDGDPTATEDPGTGDGDPTATEDTGTGDGDPAATEDTGTGDGDPAATEAASTAAAGAPSASPTDATTPAPEEPFVSSAPAEQTRRPERRPASN
jgi:OOP family OmpA-OmpF porin